MRLLGWVGRRWRTSDTQPLQLFSLHAWRSYTLCSFRFLGGDITAPTPARALRDERVSDPTDFSRFYYAAPELERHDAGGAAPFFSQLNCGRGYEVVPMEAVSLAAVTAAIEEKKVGVCFRIWACPFGSQLILCEFPQANKRFNNNNQFPMCQARLRFI